jgi:pentapeptide MXKDX repeat protein
MKKLLTLLFAIAIALSLTTATFGQDSTMKKDDTKKEEKKEKKDKMKDDKMKDDKK